MNRTTTAVLFVLVLLLGGLAWWQTSREERGDFDHVERLFDGVDAARVASIRIDHLERGQHLTLERDARRAWALTDPIAYPARPTVVEALMDVVRKGVVVRVPREELAFAQAGFDPPRALIDVNESLDGQLRTTRVELGPLDLDGSRVYVRVRGRIFRTLRNLDTLLEQDLTTYRDQSMFSMAPEEIVRVSRLSPSGDVFIGGDAQTSGLLQAHRQQFRWWLDHPVRGQADPTLFQLLLVHLTSVRVQRFVDDAPLGLAGYGLQSPRFEIELEARDGLTQKLLIGGSGGELFAKRADLPYVWGLDSLDISHLFVPATDLLDHSLVRVLRTEIARVEIENGRERIVLERSIDPSRLQRSGASQANWTVRAEPSDTAPNATPGPTPGAAPGPTPGATPGPARPANREKVEKLLAQLEHAEVIRYLEGAPLEEYFQDRERLGVWLQLREERQGGRIGNPYVTEGQAQARTFLRDGESEVSLVPADVARLLSAASVLELASLDLVELDEVHLRRLVLRGAQGERRFFRSNEGTWRYEDLDTVAEELFSVLDALFFLHASQHLAPSVDDPLAQPIEVEIMDYEGHWTKFRVGALAGHGVVGEIEGRRSVLKDQDLYRRLSAICD